MTTKPCRAERSAPVHLAAAETNPVFAPPLPLLPMGLHARIEARQLAACPGGSCVAALRRNVDGTVEIVHSSADVSLPDARFDEALIVQTFPRRGVRVWGARGEARGLWMVTPQGTRLVSRMDAPCRFERGPNGTVPVSEFGEMSARGLRAVTLYLPRDAHVAFRGFGFPETLIPMRVGGRSYWIHPPTDDSQLPDHAGAPYWPLPFTAERARVAYYDGKPLYAIVRGGQHAVWDEGRLRDITTPEQAKIIETLWTSPSGNAIAILLRWGSSSRTAHRCLMVNGQIVHEGNFYLRQEDLSFSPDGSAFVARVVRTGPDGLRGDESLVTRDGEIRFGSDATAYEPGVDNGGRLSYIVATREGRRVVANGLTSLPYGYAWNLSRGHASVSANVLVSGNIYRAVFPYPRQE